MTARQVFRMTTENNAILLGFENQLGRLEPGRLANMALIDYAAMAHPYVDPFHDPIDTLLYRGAGRFVHTVLVNGRVVVKAGRVSTIDEEAVGSRLAEAAARPRSAKEEAMVQAMDTLKARVKTYYDGWTRKVDVDPYFRINSRTDGLKTLKNETPDAYADRIRSQKNHRMMYGVPSGGPPDRYISGLMSECRHVIVAAGLAKTRFRLIVGTSFKKQAAKASTDPGYGGRARRRLSAALSRK